MLCMSALVKTLGGYFRAEKVDFDDSKSKNGYSPMDSSSFRGKNQNKSRSFHAHQIDAHYKLCMMNNNTQLNLHYIATKTSKYDLQNGMEFLTHIQVHVN